MQWVRIQFWAIFRLVQVQLRKNIVWTGPLLICFVSVVTLKIANH